MATASDSTTSGENNILRNLLQQPSNDGRKLQSNDAGVGESSDENQYFYEDEIFCLDSKGRVKFGLVLENYDASEGDDPFGGLGEDDGMLKKGEIRACWHPDGMEEVVQQCKVGLADRTLMPGDVIRRIIPGKDTQRGYCHEIFVRADVKVVGSKYVIRNVSSDRLRPLLAMPKDNAVCLDSWVGSTRSVNEKLTLKSTCGSLLEVRPDVNYCALKDADMRSRCGGYFAGTLFYPGQTLIGPIGELENATWLSGSSEMKRLLQYDARKHKQLERRFTVQSVELEGVWVNWQCKASCEEGDEDTVGELSGQQPPPDYITGADLKRLRKLNLFESCMLQINDKNYLKIEPNDRICRRAQWRKELSARYKRELLATEWVAPALQENMHINGNKHTIMITSSAADPDAAEKGKDEAVVEADRSKLFPNMDKTQQQRLGKVRRSSPRNPRSPSSAAAATTATATSGPCKLAESDEWQTDPEEVADNDGDIGEDDENGERAESSSCSSNATPKSSPKKSPALLVTKKARHHKRKISAHRLSSHSGGASGAVASPDGPPAPGEEVITETLVVYSMATVVWQDGTIEHNIPSTELCPIHHLDDHEFFPGDFVLAATSSAPYNVSFRDYGVIQRVDHRGRTAIVKWFSTYTSADSEPQPTFKGESEVSVYDLKDHPDFQYRPGTIVIRVANFSGEERKCSAGQVMDNYPSGLVKVWWVNDQISMCWPQDIFEVGQYDAEHNFWGNESDNNSWETEDETSELGGITPQHLCKPKLTANLERARVAMARLEELFIINPHLQNQDIMKKLLMVYKKCRYLDRLMNTSFFHEQHFMGLIERVRRSNNQTTAERALEHKNRLFNSSCSPMGSKLTSPTADIPYVTVGPQGDPRKKSPSAAALANIAKSSAATVSNNSQSTSSDISSIDESNAPPMLTASTGGQLLSAVASSSITDDSGHFSALGSHHRSEASSGTSTGDRDDTQHGGPPPAEEVGGVCDTLLSNELDKINNLYMNIGDDMNSTNSVFNFAPQEENVSAKLCALIKAQLVKALQEINQRYSQADLFKEIITEEVHPGVCAFESGSNLSQPNSTAGTPSTDIDQTGQPIDEPTAAAAEVPTKHMATPVESFEVLESAPSSHKFHLTVFQTNNAQSFHKAVQREHRLLRTGLPPGVWVRTFEDRLDLLSVMIEGPAKTPYEGGLFLFDIQLGQEYPTAPPLCHYISYCSDRLNPNLYEDGKVCVSLLGTWSGRGTEVWGPNSTLLQVIVSIQGLILVDEPYFNEAGYERQKGTQQGKENSRMYNEMVLLKLVQSMSKLITNPPDIFANKILHHFQQHGESMYRRIKCWMDISIGHNRKDAPPPFSDATTEVALRVASTSIADTENDDVVNLPAFPLIPASRGFCLTLAGLLEHFKEVLKPLQQPSQQ